MKELLIEKWFPIKEINIECGRERGATFPPLTRFHVWWARRPLTASRFTAALAALPAEDYEQEDFKKLLNVLGLRGDPVKVASTGSRKYGYPIFEGVNPNPRPYMGDAEELWGRKPVGADLMAGGGSIPFEMARTGYGKVVAGEYNPVAYTILKGALEYPVKYKGRLLRDYEAYGKQLLRTLRHRVKEYFPPHPRGQPLNYIWVRMFRCPECGCEIPSFSSLWLDRGKGFALYPEMHGNTFKLNIVKVIELERRRTGNKIESTVKVIEGEYVGAVFETKGYVNRGILECPKHRHTVDRDEVKRQYKEYLTQKEEEGYYGSHPSRLVAVVLKGKVYVEPTEDMENAYMKAEEDLKSQWRQLVAEDLIPLETHEKGECDRVVIYGLDSYYRMFNARQLLVHALIVRLIRELRVKVVEDEVRKGRSRVEAEEYSKAIVTYLTLVFGKLLKFNTIITSWNYSAGAIRGAFSTHAFAWTWDFGEGDQINERTGLSWCLKNSLKSLKGLVKRLSPVESSMLVVYGDAGKIDLSGKMDVIITDPPYYGNVQYSELSDYFYVWFKKILAEMYPEAYSGPEAPKQEEAVANRIRHGSRKLADMFYEDKMREVFKNHYRLLVDEGILVLWFAHKSGTAWKSTIQALLDAGFTITALWGVNAERAHSLHISGKAALRTNMIISCRKREGGGGYIQEALNIMETGMETRLKELEEYGIIGPDFLMAAQAEALKVASSHWPIKDPQGKMEPNNLLDYMMDQAIGHAVNYLTNKVAPQIIGVDAPTKFYVLVRYLYGDMVSYDDGRRIALACQGASGVSEPVQEIAVKTGLGRLGSTQVGGESTKVLTLSEPWERVRRGRVNEGKGAPVIDGIHRAIAVLEEGGSTMEAAGPLAEAGGSACEVIRALYQILPDRVQKGQGTVLNREKLHLQTLLLSVCQEGLHLVAGRELEQRETQRRLDQYQQAEPESRFGDYRSVHRWEGQTCDGSHK